LSVPDEGYSRLSNLTILSVHDEGYSRLSSGTLKIVRMESLE
jgi:hypothetical protein